MATEDNKKLHRLVLLDENGTEVEVISFDAVLSEAHEDTAFVSAFTVEKGSDISDHVRPENSQIALEVFLTNQPIQNIDADDTEQGAVTTKKLSLRPSPIPPPNRLLESFAFLSTFGPKQDSVNVYAFETPFERVNETYSKLVSVLQSGQVCTLLTSVREYSNLVLNGVSAPKDTPTDSLRVRLSFTQISNAASDTVDARPKPKIKRKNRGKQVPKPAESPEQKKSLLRSIKDSIF